MSNSRGRQASGDAKQDSDALRELVDEQTADRLRSLDDSDPERSHPAADSILCELLTHAGYPQTVAAFKKLKKWYC